MTLNEKRIQLNLTWQQLAIRLSQIAASHGDEPIYYHRLWCMRNGTGRPVSIGEKRALLEWSEGEVGSYKS